MEEGSGVELDKLHVAHCALGAVYHGNAVAGGHEGVGSSLIYSTYAAGSHHGDFRQESVYLSRSDVEHVGSVAGDIGGAAGDNLAKMVLGDDLDCEMIFVDVDVRISLDGLYEALLNLEAGIVGMMKNTEFAVSALAVEVVVAILILVEVHAPAYELAYLLGSAFHHLFHGLRVAEPVAGHHGVVDMFVEIVNLKIGHRGNAALGKRRIGLVESRFAHQCHTCLLAGHFKGKTHAGDTRTYHKIVVFKCHFLLILRSLQS